ncbi:interferon lambda-2-like [Arvicola amphibius]|uniref:interferon lambda-2-like n=1 Tax=Arvicola amphibius TaxID=1047088 RepID=UPI001C09DFD6|nr:interferon lambda-2-like [Arvicola amphibius]
MKPGEAPDRCVGACPHSSGPPALTLSSCDSETAGGRLLLLLLLAAVLTGTRAHPVPGATRLPPDAKKCHLSRFKSLAPQELQAFKKAKDAIEEWLLEKDVKCSSRLFPRGWDLQQLQVQERPKALQAELALTLEVLENVTDSALGPILHQPLHTLRHIKSQLQACTQPQPTAEPKSPSHRLSRWLHRLQEAQEKETPGCLEASVTFNLFCLLIRDLECVARGDQCV